MRTLTMTLATALLLSLVLLTGCAANTVRDLVARGGAETGKGLGKTILICRVDLPPKTHVDQEKLETIPALAEQALNETPGARRLPAETLLSRIPGRDPAGLSDAELAAAALDAGADSVIVVQVLGYGGHLTLSLLPPYWATGVDYAYHARVIDARSGALYLDAHRGRKKSGPFSAHTSRELGQDFQADLAALFGKAAGNDTVKSGS